MLIEQLKRNYKSYKKKYLNLNCNKLIFMGFWITSCGGGQVSKNTNLAPTEDESKYMNIFKYSSIAILLAVTSGFAGLWSVDPQLLNQFTVYLILIVAISYFIYLFFFAGLGTDEIENIKMLLLLFFGAVLFWAGFDQGGSSLNLFANIFYWYVILSRFFTAAKNEVRWIF